MFGENPTVLQENALDPRKALGGLPLVICHPPLRVGDLGLSGLLPLNQGRLIVNQKCLSLNQRRHRLVELVQLPVTVTACLCHTSAPVRVPSSYPTDLKLRDRSA